MKKKVLVLGVNSLEQQTMIGVMLSEHNVKFAASPEEAIRACRGADVLAIGTNHENQIPTLLKQGFCGRIIPLLVEKRQGMRVRDNFMEAVRVCKLPDMILELASEPEVVAT